MGREFGEERASVMVKAATQTDASKCKRVIKTGRDVSDAAKDMKVNKVRPYDSDGHFLVQDQLEAGTEMLV